MSGSYHSYCRYHFGQGNPVLAGGDDREFLRRPHYFLHPYLKFMNRTGENPGLSGRGYHWFFHLVRVNPNTLGRNGFCLEDERIACFPVRSLLPGIGGNRGARFFLAREEKKENDNDKY